MDAGSEIRVPPSLRPADKEDVRGGWRQRVGAGSRAPGAAIGGPRGVLTAGARSGESSHAAGRSAPAGTFITPPVPGESAVLRTLCGPGHWSAGPRGPLAGVEPH